MCCVLPVCLCSCCIISVAVAGQSNWQGFGMAGAIVMRVGSGCGCGRALVLAICSNIAGSVVTTIHQLQGWMMGNVYKLAYIYNRVSLLAPHACPW